MLTLMRTPGKSIFIGHDIKLTLLLVEKKIATFAANISFQGDELTFSLGEQQMFYINSEIKIMISRIKKTQVFIGIDAPRHITILREEMIGRPRKDKVDNENA